MPHICCNRRENGSASSTSFASASALNQYAPHKVVEPVHLDISLKFKDLSSKSAHVKVEHTFRYEKQLCLASARERSHIVLNGVAFENLEVTGEGITHSYDGKEIKLHWNTPFEPQTERKVTLEYDVDHPVSGMFFGRKDCIPESEDEYVVTDHETEKSRYWLASVDFPTVRTTLTWHITAPERLTSVANGAFIGEDIKDGYKTTNWKLDHVCPSYLTCFAVGDFIEVSDGEVDGKKVKKTHCDTSFCTKYYAAKCRKEDDIRRALDETPSMIKWLQEKVGTPFPWPKYYQILLPTIGGAMENISFVTWSDIFLLDETLAQERKQLTDCVNIHEMAHTYFGDLLVIKHFEHAWLKESWATYMESCWLQDHKTEDDFRSEMIDNAEAYFGECDNYMRPIVTRKYDSSWDIFDMHTYPGGAWRIHMLRSLLGDATFWAGVQAYVAEHAQKTVQTSDFQTALEQASGLNLTRFFDEWIYSKGYPKLNAEYSYDSQSNQVKVVLNQTQVDEKEGIPLFGFPLELEVVDDQGNVHSNTAIFDREAKVVTYIQLPSDSKPQIFRIDPDGKVLFSVDLTADQSILENTAKSAKDIFNRMQAYYELVKNGSRASLKIVQKLVKEEPYYAVRVHAADALAKLKSPFALQILAEVLENEQHPHAISAIAEKSKIADKQIRQAALNVLKREKLPYRAENSVLTVLGAQRNPEDLQYLLEVAKDDKKIGQHAIVRSGALRALASHRSEEAFKYLLTRTEVGTEPSRARPWLVRAIKQAAEWQDERNKKLAIEKLVELLRDEDQLVIRTAIGELASLKDKSTCDDIDASRALLAKDDHPYVDRKLKALESSASGGGKASAERIEKLEERIKKLESKLSEQEAKEEAAKAKKQD
ncbi:hypothetical protein NQZ79_g301 [Umbelopsis isabellina]|nr:hypothetical protein NQZ79_g301 [Umbelopsis isabellina]